MAQAYTPGLKRKGSTIVQKTRQLPMKGEVLVKEGSFVSSDNIVAQTAMPGSIHSVNIALDLELDLIDSYDESLGEDSSGTAGVKMDTYGGSPSTSSESVSKYMIKKVGDPVEKGDMIATKRSIFGLVKKYSYSPIKGKIEHISDITGQILIREPEVPVRIKAYIPGRVVKVISEEGVVISTHACFIQGIFGIGGETWADLEVLSKSPEEPLDVESITENCRNRIIVGGSIVRKEAIRKAIQLGVRGIIVGGMDYLDLAEILGYEVGAAITGEEKIGLSLVLTEGFGTMTMSKKTFQLLQRFNGKHTCISGATQIRAGVIRPEIIIPIEMKEDEQLRTEIEEEVLEGLVQGTIVRIIREPYFGSLGQIASIPVNSQRLETGSTTRVLEVELEDGKKVIIPRANVEMIEE